jgi:hypothetical protein
MVGTERKIPLCASAHLLHQKPPENSLSRVLGNALLFVRRRAIVEVSQGNEKALLKGR